MNRFRRLRLRPRARRTPSLRRTAARACVGVVGLSMLALSTLALAGCNQGGATAAKVADAPIVTPATDPRLNPHRETFGRVEALITSWDRLRGDGRTSEARGLEAQIRAEVDGQFATFAQGASGSLGPHAQYLSVSSLGFSANPQATRLLVARLLEKDADLQGNALIALSVRADPNTPIDALLNRTSPAMPVTVKRYAPLALAKVLEARQRAGIPANSGVTQQALARLGALAVDHDPVVRLHVVRALRVINNPGGYRYLAVLVGDPQMRVRWAAAGALEALGDPRGFPGVVRLLHDVAPDSKHIIRDILASFAGRLQGRPLNASEISSLGIGPRAWSQWFNVWKRTSGQHVGGQPVRTAGTPSSTVAQPAPARQPAGVVQPAPRRYVPPGASSGGR